MRVYVPATIPALRHLADTGSLPTTGRGHAVTDAVRAEDPDGEQEEWEFAAFTDAASASLALLTPQGPKRRVVVAVDVDEASVTSAPPDEAGRTASSAVALPPQLDRPAVAAVHVDGPDAAPTVGEVLDGAPEDGLDDVALEWYDPSEITVVLG